jgi:hypothetical protein
MPQQVRAQLERDWRLIAGAVPRVIPGTCVPSLQNPVRDLGNPLTM